MALSTGATRVFAAAVLFIDGRPGPCLSLRFGYAFLLVSFGNVVGLPLLLRRVFACSILFCWHTLPPYDAINPNRPVAPSASVCRPR